MSWSLNKPPAWAKDAVASAAGWRHRVTSEILVAIRSLTTKAGSADILSVKFDAAEIAEGDELSVTVRFNEKVNVTAGASIVITTLGSPITLRAAAQSGVTDVVFDLDTNLTDPVEAPAGPETLSIAAQTLGGTIVDADVDGPASNKVLSAELALEAGEREIEEIV